MPSCFVCLESEPSPNNNNNLIEYNHCGKYYIHSNCLNISTVNINPNECLICRNKIVNDIENVSQVVQSDITILNTTNEINVCRIKILIKIITGVICAAVSYSTAVLIVEYA